MLWRERSSRGRPSEISQKAMSALPPKADMCGATSDVRFGPKADMRLFDDLVRCAEQRLRNCQIERLCGLEIDNQLILGRRLHRHVGWLLALEDAIDIARGTPDRIMRIRSVRNQATIQSPITIRIDRRQFVASGETDDELAMSRRAPWRYDHAAIARTCECRHGTLDFVGVAHVQRRELNTKGLRYRSNCRELSNAGCRCGITKHQGSGHVGRDLFEQLGPFAAHAVLETREASDVAAWVGHAFDEAGTNRIGNVHEHDRDRTGGLLQRRNRYTAYAKDHIRRECDQLRRVAAKAVEIASNLTDVDLQIAADRPP